MQQHGVSVLSASKLLPASADIAGALKIECGCGGCTIDLLLRLRCCGAAGRRPHKRHIVLVQQSQHTNFETLVVEFQRTVEISYRHKNVTDIQP